MTHAVHPQQFHPHDHGGQIRIASGLNFLAGLYLLISAWANGANGGGTANGIIFGIIVAILAASRFSGATGPWASWLDALIGVWMILSPWVYRYADTGWKWNSIVVGIIMIVLGVWSAIASTTAHESPVPESRV
jgi:hypothetical protein